MSNPFHDPYEQSRYQMKGSLGTTLKVTRNASSRFIATINVRLVKIILIKPKLDLEFHIIMCLHCLFPSNKIKVEFSFSLSLAGSLIIYIKRQSAFRAPVSRV